MNKNSNTLDDFLADPKKQIFSISHGRTMKNGPVIRGILALLSGLFLLYLGISLSIEEFGFGELLLLLLGTIVFLAGAFVCFATSGVDVDMKNKLIREYLYFFKKFGTWRSIEKYPFITLIKRHVNITYGTYVGINTYQTAVTGRTEENEDYEICLLNNTHHKRITIAISKNYATAKENSIRLAEDLGLTLTDFNPVRISNRKSRSRK